MRLLALALLLPARLASADDCDDTDAWPCLHLGATVGDSLERGWLARTGAGDSTIDQASTRALGGVIAGEARWTIDGVPIDGAGGGPGLAVPLDFVDRVDVATGGLEAGARASTGGTVDATLRGDVPAFEARVWLRGGAPQRALPDAPNTYDPLTFAREAERGLDADTFVSAPIQHHGPLDRAWFAIGGAFHGDLDGLTRTARRLRDADGDGFYDRNPDHTLITDTIERRHVPDPAVTETVMLRLGGRRGGHELALTGLVQDAVFDHHTADGAPAASVIQEQALGWLGIARWTSRWPRGALALTAAWHRDHRIQAGRGGVQIGTAYLPTAADDPTDATVAAACDDAATDDPYPAVIDCPVPTGYYVRGGNGAVADTTSDTPSVTAIVRQELAHHALELGASGEDARRVITRAFTGGVLERRLAEDIVFTTRYVDPSGGPDSCGDLGSCTFLDRATRTYRTRYLAAWLADRYRPIAPLVIDAGVRWESQEVGTTLGFGHQLAPRLSFAYDPTGRGHARVFAGFSRAFAYLPLTFATAILGDTPLYTHLESSIGTSDTLDSSHLGVAHGSESPRIDTLVAGAEWIAVERVDLGAAITQTALWHAIDVAGDQRGTRDTRELRAWLGNAPDARLRLRLGWVHTSAIGTCDLATFACPIGNDDGLLPQDLPHRFFAEAATTHRRGSWDLDLGARFTIGSGAPFGAQAGPRGDVPLLPRGSVGRMPPHSSVVLHLGATHHALTLGLDLIDLFDRRAPAALDERWTTDGDVLPIAGGSEADLPWLRDVGGGRVRPNPAYRTPTRFFAPASARILLSAQF